MVDQHDEKPLAGFKTLTGEEGRIAESGQTHDGSETAVGGTMELDVSDMVEPEEGSGTEEKKFVTREFGSGEEKGSDNLKAPQDPSASAEHLGEGVTEEPDYDQITLIPTSQEVAREMGLDVPGYTQFMQILFHHDTKPLKDILSKRSPEDCMGAFYEFLDDKPEIETQFSALNEATQHFLKSAIEIGKYCGERGLKHFLKYPGTIASTEGQEGVLVKHGKKKAHKIFRKKKQALLRGRARERVLEALSQEGVDLSVNELLSHLPEKERLAYRQLLREGMTLSQMLKGGALVQTLMTDEHGIIAIEDKWLEKKMTDVLLPDFNIEAVDLSFKLRAFMGFLKDLAVMHENGQVHRDLKPDNLMWDDEVKKIAMRDFGLLKDKKDEVHTASGVIRGTLEMMPPEQVKDGLKLVMRGHFTDEEYENMAKVQSAPGVDVFAAGMILYFLLAGKIPFTTLSPEECNGNEGLAMRTTIYNKVTEDISPIEGIDQQLMLIIEMALERKPWDRYQNAGEFLQALMIYYNNELARISSSI